MERWIGDWCLSARHKTRSASGKRQTSRTVSCGQRTTVARRCAEQPHGLCRAMVYFCGHRGPDLRTRIAAAEANGLNFPTDPVFYLVSAVAVILVGIAKGGFSGLGAASMPLLVLVMDPVAAAAMLLPILIVQDVVGVWAFRKSFDLPTLKLMLPSALLGIFLGWWLAAAVPSQGVRAIVGLIALFFGANRLCALYGIALKLKGPLPEWLGAFWGGVSGFTSQVAHAGGPPFQAWALTRKFPQLIYAGTSGIFFAIINWAKVPAYIALGQMSWANMQLSLLFLPLAIASTYVGIILVKRVSPARFNIAISIIMVLVGIELLRDAVF
jgi:uncharacterized protein